MAIDWKGLNPAPVTLFKDNGDVDFEANARLAQVARLDRRREEPRHPRPRRRGHLPHPRRAARADPRLQGRHPAAGRRRHHRRGHPRRRRRRPSEKYDAGATAALVYPNHGWLRFGYQKGAPQTRYEAIAQSGLECILFQYPAATKANYDLDTQLEICAIEGVTATKNGVRDMKRWYNEIPAIKNAFPEIAVMSCHDEWLLPTMFDVDGLLVGYGNMAPELLIEYLAAGKAQDYHARPQVPRAAAADHPRGLPPRLAHGGLGRAQARAARPRHSSTTSTSASR